jgi:hypothetical protein
VLRREVARTVQERCVDAGAVRAADPWTRWGLTEEVSRSDVLEREVATGLDRQNVIDLEQVAERADNPIRVSDHLPKRVDALHLRGQKVVSRATVDPGVPGDAQLSEQRECLVTDLGEQRQG